MKKLLCLLLALALCAALLPCALAFDDVAPGDYYFEAVEWLSSREITSGTGGGAFSPDKTCTRAETVTFLWRIMGEPGPAASDCPFADVDPDAYYYKPVLWAVENGVTKGVSDTAFDPNGEVTRAMAATLLYRTLKLQGKGYGSDPWAFRLDFTDAGSVPGWSYEAFCWTTSQGVVRGADGALLPLETCTRGQLAAMLYRAFA